MALLVGLGGLAVTGGSFLTWISATGGRPQLGVNQTSLSHMLTYMFVSNENTVHSVGFVIRVLGIIMIIGAILGLRMITWLASLLAVALGIMWFGLVVHYFNTPGLPNIYYLNPLHLPWADLRLGAWLALAGAVLGLLLSPFLRRSRAEKEA